MTIKKLLSQSILCLKNNSKSPKLDAQVLICDVLRKDAGYLIAHPDIVIINSDLLKINKYILRRAKGEPIAYILGHKEFYNLDYFVNENVLIPRPETEYLVEYTIGFINRNSVIGKRLSIIDIGAGSGNIIISIIKQLSNDLIRLCNFYAVDINFECLQVAQKNAKIHQVDKNIKFYQSDIFSNSNVRKKYNLIIANLPYVPMIDQKTQNIDDSIVFEPKTAIYAKNNGTSEIKKLLNQSKNRLKPKGILLIELDPRNALELKKYSLKIYPKAIVEIKKDLSNLNRYLIIQSK